MSGPASAALDPEQRGALLGAKLRGLVAGRWGADASGQRVTGRLPGGATLVDPALGLAWVLAEDDGARSLGAALARALADAREIVVAGGLHVIVADRAAAGVVARQATQFRVPCAVWHAEGADVTPAPPAPPHVPVSRPEGVESLVALLEAEGLEVLLEHGTLIGAWRGLEVARIVVHADGGAHLDVGIGRHDREAFGMVHGELPAPEALGRVLASVRDRRALERPDSPLTRLSRQRWLRQSLIEAPGLVGAATLVAVEPTVVSTSVKDTVAATAIGVTPGGGALVVACTAGADLDAVPAAADARLAYAPDAELVIAVPERDRHRVTVELAEALVAPGEVRIVPVPWEGRR